MARRKRTAEEVHQWEIGSEAPAAPAAPRPPSSPVELGAETSEWVIHPPGAPVVEQRRAAAANPGSEPELAELRERVAELTEALGAERARAEVAETRAAEAEARAAEAEKKAAEASAAPVAAAPPVQAVETASAGRTRELRGLADPGDGDPLDVNAIDYGQLRELGLSVSESARLLAVRDVRGGFRSLDELEEIRDLPPELLPELQSRLHV
jgi:DNA uptake protein ComE-like DNA-binding protein